MQQITIFSESVTTLRPLLESAIQTELRLIGLGIERTEQKLVDFERQYEMMSAEFETLLDTGKIDESLDYIEWSGEIETLRRLQTKYQTLQRAQLS
ncbi:MAG: hypothetical protein KJZ86_06225 [Caldilineaceae bacterium]|nr:hypothetical protein [Caldilineaceae bacterium]HRJ43112.1 hypothetical protein [Caldilineaceae bacterium]